ncbi:hypothetical protein BZG36_05266 [Bifiguratus adelaidae]|uniref:protein-tyrosine-phosphatase n=1 Tax=Bifiguratus adelaidae TaxID=1938954 RepID=A0A261XTL6_9FUNG|nr:hypothetical protein BZG36_05266 [Bifiguratus adelaidae]
MADVLRRDRASLPKLTILQRRRPSTRLGIKPGETDEIVNDTLSSRHAYRHGPIAILPGLYLGNEDNAKNLESLRQLNIGLVVCVASDVKKPDWVNDAQACQEIKSSDVQYTHNPPSRIRYIHESWSHQAPIADSLALLLPHLDYFHDAHTTRTFPTGILIHCHCGISRSASLLIAFIMYKYGWTFDTTYAYVKSKCDVVSPHIGLLMQVRDIETWKRGSRKRILEATEEPEGTDDRGGSEEDKDAWHVSKKSKRART